MHKQQDIGSASFEVFQLTMGIIVKIYMLLYEWWKLHDLCLDTLYAKCQPSSQINNISIIPVNLYKRLYLCVLVIIYITQTVLIQLKLSNHWLHI